MNKKELMSSNWALIKMINDVETVHNIIVAEEEVALQNLVANDGNYDFVLDTSNYDPEPQIGYTYDSGLDEFTAPAIDYADMVTTSFTDLHNLLVLMRDNGSLLSAQDLQDAIDLGVANTQNDLVSAENIVVAAVAAWVPTE